jgi:hypothetical protein
VKPLTYQAAELIAAQIAAWLQDKNKASARAVFLITDEYDVEVTLRPRPRTT